MFGLKNTERDDYPDDQFGAFKLNSSIIKNQNENENEK